MKRMVVVLMILTAIGIGEAQTAVQSFKIKYLTGESVYLDGGLSDGLVVGNRLLVDADGVTATLEVTYLAEHSAACRVVESQGTLQVGAAAVLVSDEAPSEVPSQARQSDEEEAKEQTAERRPARKAAPRRRSGNGSRISGSASLQFYRLNDLTDSGLDFTQPTFRLNLNGRNLWGKEYTLRIRSRTRYNQRARSFSEAAPRTEWRNRVYEMSFGYQNPQAAFNFQVGRIIANYMSGVGYIDGIQLQHNLSPNTRVGILAGTQPDWRDSNFQTSIQKYGAYFNLSRGDYQSRRFESTIAAAAEYHSSVVSREFIYVQNSYSHSNSFYFFQSAEVDVNRNWRKERAGQTLSLSSLFLSTRYRFSPAVSAGVTFDNRKNYRTYETRTIADSLFDDALRTGVRGNLSLRLPGRVLLYSNVGYRKRKTDTQATYSYAGGLTKANLLLRGLSLSLNAAGFSNQFTDGLNGSGRLAQSLGGGHRLEAAYGTYTYTINSSSQRRHNQWAQAVAYVAVQRHIFISGQFEYNWGDDLKGQRIFAELGYRF